MQIDWGIQYIHFSVNSTRIIKPDPSTIRFCLKICIPNQKHE